MVPRTNVRNTDSLLESVKESELMQESVILEKEHSKVFEDLEDGQYFMLASDESHIYRTVRWPGEKLYIIDMGAATIHTKADFVSKEVILLEVKEPLRLKKAK